MSLGCILPFVHAFINPVSLQLTSGPLACFAGADSLAAKDLEAATGATEPPEQKPLSRFLAGLFCALGFLKMGFLKFSDIIPIPTIVSLIGLAIGCCPPIKNFLFGEHAPLAFATTALAVLAQAIIPVMSFTLGAVLYK